MQSHKKDTSEFSVWLLCPYYKYNYGEMLEIVLSKLFFILSVPFFIALFFFHRHKILLHRVVFLPSDRTLVVLLKDVESWCIQLFNGKSACSMPFEVER